MEILVRLTCRGVTSGLVNAERTLKTLKIAFVNFEASDVVRHPVVAQIIQAYEKNNKSIPKQLGEGVKVPFEKKYLQS